MKSLGVEKKKIIRDDRNFSNWNKEIKSGGLF